MAPKRITSEEDFLNECAPAPDIRRHVEALEAATPNRWFFEKCWADWHTPKFTAIFRSYRLPEYKDYILSVEASRSVDGQWAVRTIKQVPQ